MEFLPRVREGTVCSVTRSVYEEYGQDGKFITKYMAHLKKVNPRIMYTIMKLVNDLEPEQFVYTTFCLCMLYRMLESEAEAQQFEKEIGEING